MPVLQVLTKAALLAYERLHVAQFIVDTEWNPEGSPYTSKLEAAWCFDVINSREPRPPYAELSYQIPVGQVEAPSDLHTVAERPANTLPFQTLQCNPPILNARYTSAKL